MQRILSLWLIMALFGALLPPGSRAHAQRATADPALALFESLTIEERIGQLFMVAFVGRDTRPGSQIATLLQTDKIGGVVLLAADGNFRNGPDTPRQIAALTENLQGLVTGPNGVTGVPLFVAIDHEGDGYPYSRITGGVTPLASPLALGATWDPALAEATGYVAGLELSSLGINMVLGPTLDVLHSPRGGGRGDLGIRTFGGDPFWVGRMGSAYIQGLHEGSQGRIVNVAKHFPGHGGSDRLPDDEVATVDKSLQELRRIELAPFFAVTQKPPGWAPNVTDALMTSHIRYRGFQGENIRQFTAPISFDPVSLRTIMELPEFEQWRDQGLMVSDALGVPAVRKYYDPTLQSFPHRRIAQEALNAGNDLLILAQFDLNNRWNDQYNNIRDTVAFFRDSYVNDASFKARVDAAVMKVLRTKLRLYPDLGRGRGRAVLPLTNPDIAGRRTEVTETVARGALTLLYPRTPADLAARLPGAPRHDEQIVIFTDSREVRECFEECPLFSPLPVDALQQAILRLYGPQATNEVRADQIRSFSFHDLKAFVATRLSVAPSDPNEVQPATATPAPIVSEVAQALQEAEWIVLALQDILPASDPRPGAEASDAARLFLDTVADSLFDRKIVAFAFNIPYQLDTTEVSKLSAYFALYSKQQPFVDTAARALFLDAAPVGMPPVSVEAIKYDLATQLQPAPLRPLRLTSQSRSPVVAPANVAVTVGPVFDRNGHLVPDGTAIELVSQWEGENGQRDRLTVTTVSGVARAQIPVLHGGRLAISAQSFEAISEEALVIEATGALPSPTATVALPPENEPLPSPSAAVEARLTPTTVTDEEPPSNERTPQPEPDRPMPLATATERAVAVVPRETLTAAPPTIPEVDPTVSSETRIASWRPATPPGPGNLVIALSALVPILGMALRGWWRWPIEAVRRAALAVNGGLAAFLVYAIWLHSPSHPLVMTFGITIVGALSGVAIESLLRERDGLKGR